MEVKREDLKLIIREAVQEAFDMKKESEKTLTIQKCAEYTNIGREKITELINNPNIDFPYFKVGTKTLIHKELLDEWLEKVSKEKTIL